MSYFTYYDCKFSNPIIGISVKLIKIILNKSIKKKTIERFTFATKYHSLIIIICNI